MKIYAPDYYKDFRCLASACRHNCCIGWEIDIDEQTLAAYDARRDALGERLRACIDREDGCAHFRLGEGDRCPFLNGEGLCDIILAAGEEALCEICTLHPRYRHFLSTRTELGLGLSCEAVAALLTQREEPVRMTVIDEDDAEEEPNETERVLLETRDALIALAEERSVPLSEREAAILKAVHASALPPACSYAALYRGLERLDAAWETRLDLLSHASDAPDGYADVAGEQLLVYFLLRHIPRADSEETLIATVRFAVHASRVIRAIAHEGGESIAEVARLYSSEIEYSEENTEALIWELYE